MNIILNRENIKWYNKKSMLMWRQEIKRYLRMNALINMLIFRIYARIKNFSPFKITI